LQVERIINDLSMLDALNMIEGYLNLLVERVDLIEKERVCPGVLKESIATLFYAAYEILDFPELQRICCILIARFDDNTTINQAANLGMQNESAQRHCS